MENNLKWIVYCTVCNITKKIYIGVHQTNLNLPLTYIGCGVLVNNPSTYERCKTPFLKAVKKYGPKNFTRITIAQFDNEDDAYALEADIVNEEFLKRNDVYNLALGGKVGGLITQRVPCYLYNENGEFIREFKSYLEASLQLTRNLRTIQRAIKDKTKCSGYYLTNIKYDKLDLSKMYNYEGLHKIPVYLYDEYGKYECCYESISSAARILKWDDTCIGRSIKLGIKYKNKYFSNIFNSEFSNAKSDQIVSKEVHQYGLDGKYIASYKNMQEAKNILGIKSNIYSAIKLDQLCGGFLWRFDKFENIKSVISKSGRKRRIGKFDKEWNLIKEYKSLAECKRENGSGMLHVLTGRDLFAKGYRYKYLD